jgi:hypothetical protein
VTEAGAAWAAEGAKLKSEAKRKWETISKWKYWKMDEALLAMSKRWKSEAKRKSKT